MTGVDEKWEAGSILAAKVRDVEAGSKVRCSPPDADGASRPPDGIGCGDPRDAMIACRPSSERRCWRRSAKIGFLVR